MAMKRFTGTFCRELNLKLGGVPSIFIALSHSQNQCNGFMAYVFSAITCNNSNR